MDESSATNEVGLAATVANPFSERDLRWIRSMAGFASVLLIAWSALFAYALTADPDEREPVTLFFATLLCLGMALG